MLGPQLVERLGNHLGPNERAGGDHEHGRIREHQLLGGDYSAEVGLVTDDEVGSPGGAQLEHRGHPLPRGPANEALA